jgi:hypothetical protein
MEKMHDIHALAIIGIEYFDDVLATRSGERQISSIADFISLTLMPQKEVTR